MVGSLLFQGRYTIDHLSSTVIAMRFISENLSLVLNPKQVMDDNVCGIAVFNRSFFKIIIGNFNFKGYIYTSL